MKRVLYTFILFLTLVACSAGEAQQPTESPAPEEGQAAAITAQPAPEDTVPAPTPTVVIAETATETPQDIAGTPTVSGEPTEASPPDPTAATAGDDAAVAVNGRSEDGAYFLGSADAPVTIIDYSDFL